MKVVNSIIELVGNTPIVKLNRVVDENCAEVLVKLEYFNPGSSVKDRIALSMIEKAEAEGKLKKGSVIVEPTSGNTGIGLSIVGASKGYKVILIMPDTMTMERRSLLKAYGAQLILTPGEKGMKGAIEKAQELVQKNQNYFMPQQFENPHNPAKHMETTGIEILNQSDGKVDVFIAGVGTGGTVTGVGKLLKEKVENIKIVAVEPYSSPVLSGGGPGSHKIQGIGAGFIPEVLDMNVIDEIEKVKDEEAIDMTRSLARKEGLLLGISSGAAIFAAVKKAKELGKGKRIVVIAPDSGERYLSTGIFE
ncbi:cysteine synthase A [Proteiniborus ethanoligenes]|uniref:Cysteine synthase n=1 Tax=Proteiniborus ethanoligenes TaxID=415015 RepID=A0A1H3QRR1_9FIRM|nr:cysteine synthase A [Proteiniborus ethanoligenes]SDZ15751.1 cysteine synthase A [Proteiniborus ethanoligenes]